MTDWQKLHAEAVAAMKMAYCPYSKYPVGAAGIVDDGRIVTGCNVENAALGVCLCAECGMISQLIREGGGKLTAFLCVNGLEELTTPCGRCRQLLWEHGTPETLIKVPAGVLPLSEIMPYGFGNDDLEKVTHEI